MHQLAVPQSIVNGGPQTVGRDPNLGLETFQSRNNLNLHFKFAILVRINATLMC